MALSHQGARTLSLSLSFVLAFAGADGAIRGQQVAAGYQQQNAALPIAASTVLVRKNGDTVWFDGQDLWQQAPGSPPLQLLHAGFVFGSFVIEAGADRLLFGESSTHYLWLVDLQAPPPTQPLCKVEFNYDAVLLAPGRVLVSAKLGGFASMDNQLVIVDLPSGKRQLVAVLPGPSGPVAVAANGDVFYATSTALFPPPPGLVSILRFPRAKFDRAAARRQVLGVAQADVVYSGIDAASDLCFDDDDDLFFADWMNHAAGELNDATGPAPTLAPPIATMGSTGDPVSLHFVPAITPGTAVLEPFQPAAGELRVHETNWFSTNGVRRVAALRPELTASIPSPVPAGTFAMQFDDGPADATGLLAIALGSGGSSVALVLPGFEQPLAWNLAFATPIFLPVALDASGLASIAVTNPGFSPAALATAQAALVSPLGVLASTTAITFTLGS